MSESVPQRRIGAAPIVAIVLGFVFVGAMFVALLGFFFLGARVSSAPVVTTSPSSVPATSASETQPADAGESGR